MRVVTISGRTLLSLRNRALRTRKQGTALRIDSALEEQNKLQLWNGPQVEGVRGVPRKVEHHIRRQHSGAMHQLKNSRHN